MAFDQDVKANQHQRGGHASWRHDGALDVVYFDGTVIGFGKLPVRKRSEYTPRVSWKQPRARPGDASNCILRLPIQQTHDAGVAAILASLNINLVPYESPRTCTHEPIG